MRRERGFSLKILSDRATTATQSSTLSPFIFQVSNFSSFSSSNLCVSIFTLLFQLFVMEWMPPLNFISSSSFPLHFQLSPSLLVVSLCFLAGFSLYLSILLLILVSLGIFALMWLKFLYYFIFGSMFVVGFCSFCCLCFNFWSF